MKKVKYTLSNEKIKYLMSTNERLSLLINYIGPISVNLEQDGFKCLVQYIIGQQISDKTRETLWKRLNNKYKIITPKIILNTEESDLRQLGISSTKIKYIKNIAQAIINKEVDLNTFNNMENSEIIKTLTKIKGIGKWTAEMYLIFSLGRENVLSNGDATIKRCLKWLYELNTLPNNQELQKYFQKWLDYSTIISMYFWKTVELNILDKLEIKDLKKS